MATTEQCERTTRGNKRCKSMTRGSIYANGTLVFTLSGAFLVLVGFVMPYWVTFDYPHPCPSNKPYGVTVYVSVWYCMVCDMDTPTYCRMKGIALHPKGNFKFSQLSGCCAEELSDRLASGLGDYQLWTAVPIVMSFGLGLLFVAAIMVEVWRCAGYNNRKFVTAICCFLLLGGVAVLAMVILVSVGVGISFGVPEYKIKVGTFHWSILTSGIGSLLVLVGGVLAAIEVCMWKELAKEGNNFDNLRNIEPGSSTHANPAFTGDGDAKDIAYSLYSGTHDKHGIPREKTGSSYASSDKRFTGEVGRGVAYGDSPRYIDNYGRSSSAHSNQRFNKYDDGWVSSYDDYGRSSYAHSNQRSTGYDAVRGGSYDDYGRSSFANSNQRSTGYDAFRGGSYDNYGRRPGATGQTEHIHYRAPSDQANVIYAQSSKQRLYPSF